MSPWIAAGTLAIIGSLALTWLLAITFRLARWTTYVERLPVHGHPSNHRLAYVDVSFRSSDGIPLSGWYLPSADDGRCVVVVHGEEHHRNSPGIKAIELGRDLVAEGFSVLLFDLRGRGESGGRRASAGNKELLDVLAAIDYVASRGIPPERTGLLGFSLGAALVIYAALARPRVPAIVCDSAFADLLDDYRHLRLGPLPVPQRISTNLVVLMSKLFFASDPARIRPIEHIQRLHPRPVFFIHGKEDATIPSQESVALFQHYPNPKNKLWIVPGAGHVRSYATIGRRYAERVADFFNANME